MRRKSIVALVAASAVIVPAGVFASSASATTSQSFTKYFLKGGTTPVKGIQVSGFTDSVYFAVTSDVPVQATFKLGSTTGLSLPFGLSGLGAIASPSSFAYPQIPAPNTMIYQNAVAPPTAVATRGMGRIARMGRMF